MSRPGTWPTCDHDPTLRSIAVGLAPEDRLDIREVIELHGHLADGGAVERLDEVFHPDLELDLSALGFEKVPASASGTALDAYIEAGRRRGPGEGLAMHASNIIIREHGDGAQAWSKGMIVNRDGSISCFSYQDDLVRTGVGWRIRRRTITPRRDPGQGPTPPAAA